MTDQLNLQRERYPGAERNRRAKLKFFSELKSFYKEKQKAFIESISSEEKKEEPKVDLSVPGTPVCSRYLRSLSRRQSESEEAQQEPVQLPNEILISSMVIDKCLKDMKALNADEEEQHAEVVHIEEDKTDNEDIENETDSGTKPENLTQQYFNESEEKHAYQRTFSEVVQTLHRGEVRSPVVKRYFNESTANNSYSRNFNEAFSELDPEKLRPDPLLIDSEIITKGYKTSVPGTPICSTHLNKLKKHNYISDSSDDEKNDVPKNRTDIAIADPLEKFIKDMEQLKLNKDNDIIERKPLNTFAVDEYLASSEEKKTYARTFSQAAQTLYASEVKSPTVKQYFDQSELKKTFRRDFSEVYQEINKAELPINMDSTIANTVPMEKNDIAEYPIQKIDSLEELFEKHPQEEKNNMEPVKEFCAKSYLTSSEARKTYSRTFSEAAQSINTRHVENSAIQNYFDQSETKKTFRRGFSEAYQEVDIKEITPNVIPSSRALELASNELHEITKQNSNSISCSSAVDGTEISANVVMLTDENPSIKQTKRSISVPGTPINSRKLYPKDKQQRPINESKPKYDTSTTAHSVRARAVSATENSMEKEFWKSFGAAAV
ncbi:uncharacterized protein LOC131676552 [Topomyia yanbarensis]|uniref:uncharacterized protein LOC131676552 n=1 Tax=Topomyia yanbarensis TaxID=2498891 RepID=UPI00273BEC88|nr:uncharacterized protein LOC131676552 [Topomyia yanbarensis]